MVDSNRSHTGGNGTHDDGKDSLSISEKAAERSFTRRDSLKLAGMAAVALPLGMSGLTTAGDDYEVVTVPAGQTVVREVGSGETLSNVLFDMSASGALAQVRTHGSNWRVENVGFRGTVDRNRGGVPLMLSGDHGVVENVYLGDGSVGHLDLGPIGCYIQHDRSDGPIEFRNVHVARWVNNGIYGAPTVPHLQGAVVHIRDSYFDSNNMSQFKVGTALGVCEIENVTIRTDGNPPPIANGIVNPRGIWALDDHPGETVTRVTDCDIQANLNPYPDAIIELENTRWDGADAGSGTIVGRSVGEPDLTPPDGVPMTPEEAASGSSKTAQEDDELSNVLTIHDEHAFEKVTYEFSVSGDLEKSTDNDATIDDEDVIDGSTATGHVWGWKDSYRFSGELTDFEADGPVTVTLNGEEVDLAALMSEHERVITIHDDHRRGKVTYEFSVSGDLEKSIDDDATIDDEDVIDGSTATGHVWGWKDSYRFSGELTDFEADGPVTVYVDGEEIDPETL